MKNLNLYIKESLLDDEEDLINSQGIQAYEWLKRHKALYRIKDGKVNDDGTIDADYVEIENIVDDDLIPDYIQFNKVRIFCVKNCRGIKNCKGFPKESDKIILANCTNLETLEGFLKGTKINTFMFRYDGGYYHHKLKSLKGMPDCHFVYLYGFEFKNLNGMTDAKVDKLSIQYCDKLEKLNVPKTINYLSIEYCRKLKDLSKLPKMDFIFVNHCNLPKEMFNHFTKKLQYV